MSSTTSAAPAAPPGALVEAVPALTPRQLAASYVGTVVAMAQAELYRARRERSHRHTPDTGPGRPE